MNADRTAAYACGYAESCVASALRLLRDIPKPSDDIAATKLLRAIAELEDAKTALAEPFDVAREGRS